MDSSLLVASNSRSGIYAVHTVRWCNTARWWSRRQQELEWQPNSIYPSVPAASFRPFSLISPGSSRWTSQSQNLSPVPSRPQSDHVKSATMVIIVSDLASYTWNVSRAKKLRLNSKSILYVYQHQLSSTLVIAKLPWNLENYLGYRLFSKPAFVVFLAKFRQRNWEIFVFLV